MSNLSVAPPGRRMEHVWSVYGWYMDGVRMVYGWCTGLWTVEDGRWIVHGWCTEDGVWTVDGGSMDGCVDCVCVVYDGLRVVYDCQLHRRQPLSPIEML